MDVAALFNRQNLTRAAEAAAGGDWNRAVSALGRGAVRSITIRTQISPPITLDPFAEAPPDAPPNPFLAFLKPEITVETPTGAMTVAPYGRPTTNYLPWLIAATVLVGLGVTIGIGMVARRL